MLLDKNASLHGCRCFPKFPENFTGSLYSMINTTSGVLNSAVSTAQSQWSSGGPLFSNYVADISKGILIIVIGGLACGMVMSLVRLLVGMCRLFRLVTKQSKLH